MPSLLLFAFPAKNITTPSLRTGGLVIE